MYKYKLIISYDGTNYFGWQIQKNKISIQETIQNVLKKILKSPIIIYGAGRTDAKVHALGQVAHFTYDKKIDLNKFLFSVNSLLPNDIKILKIFEVDESFHARFSAKGKIYRYHLSISNIQSPFSYKYSYKPIYQIDIDLLKKAKNLLIGTHNFSSFSNKQYQGSALNSPMKTMKRIDIIENEDKIILELEANGFLYKMARNIVSALLTCASKKISVDDLKKILKAKNRKLCPAPAPAYGLFLEKVIY